MARRGKDIDWNIYENGNTTWEKVPIAVLMDIRDEIKANNVHLIVLRQELGRLNSLLCCPSFMEIPRILRGIRRKIPARKKPDGDR